MKIKSDFISRYTVIGIYVFLFIMMLLGSFTDYQISCVLYDEKNPVAVFFAAYGEYPVFLDLIAAGTMLFYSHDKTKHFTGISQCASGTVMITFGGVLACHTPTDYLNCSIPVIILLGLSATVLTIAGTCRICRDADQAVIRQVAFMIFLVIISEVLLVNGLKFIWDRARMRLVANNACAYFMNWWQPDSALKTTLVAAGIAADEFKSFPSGHTANAATAMLLPVLSYIRPELCTQHKMFWCGFIFAWIVGVSRIIAGAHYLTDVTIGFGITFTLILIFNKALFER